MCTTATKTRLNIYDSLHPPGKFGLRSLEELPPLPCELLSLLLPHVLLPEL
jgi:hypothetical protein